MGSKKKRRKDEARIREGMATLLAQARAAGPIAEDAAATDPVDQPAPVSMDQRRTRGPQKAPTKKAVSIRLDRDVLAELRRGGKGWQTRVNAMLRDALSLDR